MSVTVSCVQTVELRTDYTPTVTYDNVGGELHIYPEGVGVGPMIAMTLPDWKLLKTKVDAVVRHSSADADWSSYRATEGNGDAL